MDIAAPYRIDGEIRYQNRVFQVGVRRRPDGCAEVAVFEYRDGTRTHMDTFSVGWQRRLDDAYGMGIGFIMGYVNKSESYRD